MLNPEEKLQQHFQAIQQATARMSDYERQLFVRQLKGLLGTVAECCEYAVLSRAMK